MEKFHPNPHYPKTQERGPARRLESVAQSLHHYTKGATNPDMIRLRRVQLAEVLEEFDQQWADLLDGDW